MRRTAASLLCCLLTLSASLALAQGVLISSDRHRPIPLPRPKPLPPERATYRIDELKVEARLTGRVAQVQVSETFHNPSRYTLEAAFVFPLPYDGAIDQMTLLVDGRELPGRLLPADEAAEFYQRIVRKNRDPALLEWMGRGLFKTSVFPIPAGASRTVTLRYTQICPQDRGLTDFIFPLRTAHYTAGPLDRLRIDLSIETSQPIQNVYSPSHAVDIRRNADTTAHVSYEARHVVPSEDFRLLYDVGDRPLRTTLFSYRPDAEQDGYLLLLASPPIEPADATPQPKTVIFVVDRSGSMSGKKIEQAKAALKFVLGRLREGDLFNIVAYDSEVASFAEEVQRYTPQTQAAATAFVDGLFAGGSTNIDAALRTALLQLTDSQRPSYLLFLTDGLPTAGEQNETKIVAAAKAANQVRARLFTFGVGYDVNSRLLDKLARANHGRSQYVRPNEDIEQHVARLYHSIESPVLTQATIEFRVAGTGANQPAAVYRVYPKGDFDLFRGQQLLVVARYRRSGDAKIILRGRLHGKTVEFPFDAHLVRQSSDQRWAFVEKIWATRRIGEIIDQIDLHGQNDELIQELVELSTRHGILTPYTSFLADESVGLHDVAENATTAAENLRALEKVSGRSGFVQREMKARLQSALQPAPVAAPVGDFDGRRPKVDTVRRVGNKTFYRRQNMWIDSMVATRNPTATAERVAQFSDRYFELLQELGPRAARYFTLDEAVIVKIGSHVYHIVPPNP